MRQPQPIPHDEAWDRYLGHQPPRPSRSLRQDRITAQKPPPALPLGKGTTLRPRENRLGFTVTRPTPRGEVVLEREARPGSRPQSIAFLKTRDPATGVETRTYLDGRRISVGRDFISRSGPHQAAVLTRSNGLREASLPDRRLIYREQFGIGPKGERLVMRAVQTAMIGGAMVTLGAPRMRTYSVIPFQGTAIHRYQPYFSEPPWYRPFLAPFPKPMPVGPECPFCPPPVVAFFEPVVAYTDPSDLLGDLVLAGAVQEQAVLLAATAGPAPGDPEIDALAAEIGSLQQQLADWGRSNEALRASLAEQQVELQDLEQELASQTRAEQPNPKLAVPESVRRQVRRQVQQCIALHAEKKPLSLPDVIASADARNYVFQVGDRIDAAQFGSGEPCTLTGGDLVRLTEVPTEADAAKIVVVASKPGGCAVGTVIGASMPELQEMLNGFSQRLEAGMKRVHDRVEILPVKQSVAAEQRDYAATKQQSAAEPPASPPKGSADPVTSEIPPRRERPSAADRPAADGGSQNSEPKKSTTATAPANAKPIGQPVREAAEGPPDIKPAPSPSAADSRDPKQGAATDRTEPAKPADETVQPPAKSSGLPEAAKHAQPASAAVQTASPSRPALTGTVAGVIDAATLVIGERQVRLQGVDPGPAELLGSFAAWLQSRSPVECREEGSGLYRCYGSNGVDVGEAAILNGIGRAAPEAGTLYKERETEARQARRGLWKGKP
jgi:endonuclease YncB( thermonuclease family)